MRPSPPVSITRRAGATSALAPLAGAVAGSGSVTVIGKTWAWGEAAAAMVAAIGSHHKRPEMRHLANALLFLGLPLNWPDARLSPGPRRTGARNGVRPRFAPGAGHRRDRSGLQCARQNSAIAWRAGSRFRRRGLGSAVRRR